MTPDREEIEQRVESLKAQAKAQLDARSRLAGITAHPLVAKLGDGLHPNLIGAEPPDGGDARLAGVHDELTMLTGFISEQIDQGDRSWRLLYTDPTANEYLVIAIDDIVAVDPHAVDLAPFGRIDYVWVRADARIGQGDNTTSLAGLLTAGGFTRAGDFRGSFSASASDSGTSGLGPLCTARTPCCCTKRTT
jgi:hypothetical protein